MEMTGQQDVSLSQEKTWQALNDPDVLAACVPGCESMERAGDNEFRAKLRTSVGPVSARFKGRVTLSEVMPPESYKMTFKGDGTAGFVQGTANVRLSPSEAGDGTAIHYDAQARVGGKLAQVGSRLIDGAARKMVDEFFANLASHMGGTTQAATPVDEQPQGRVSGTGILAAIMALIDRLFGRRRDS